MKIGILGCGHMGGAIVKALIAAGTQKIHIGNPEKPHLLADKEAARHIMWTVDNKEVVKKTDVVVIAVRPNIVQPVLQEIAPALKPNHVLISIAAGINLARLKKWSNHKKLAHVMPNLAAQVFESMSVWIASKGLSNKEKGAVETLLKTFGEAFEVRDEKSINMATAVCGGGPAYTAAFLESMSDALQKNGFSKELARAAALQTVLGSAHYIKKTKIDFAALKKAVQTKGGTTEAGFKILKKKKWQTALGQAFKASCKRANKLS